MFGLLTKMGDEVGGKGKKERKFVKY